jgi:hypothetical protein
MGSSSPGWWTWKSATTQGFSTTCGLLALSRPGAQHLL